MLAQQEDFMKSDIHPNYKPVNVLCGCGNEFVTRSTHPSETMRIEVCSACHPFYTGKHKILDTEGRVDQFMRRYAAKQTQASAALEAKPVAAPSKKAKSATKTTKAKATKAAKESKKDPE